MDVTLGEGFEDVAPELHMTEFRVVFGSGIGSRAQEVSIIAEDERGHYGIKVNNTEYATIFVEEDVVHLRVAVTGSFGQLSLALQLFSERHVVHVDADFFEHTEHSIFVHTSNGVLGDHISQLLKSELQVVEIRNGLHERGGEVGKQ